MQYRIVVWVMTVAAVPLALLIVGQYQLDRQGDTQIPLRDAELISGTLAAVLQSETPGHWREHSEAIAEAAGRDERISLLMVYDTDRQAVHQYVADPLPDPKIAPERLDLESMALSLGKARMVGTASPHAVCMAPIWSLAEPDDQKAVQGYVLAALHQPAQAHAGWFRLMHLWLALGSLVLIFPAVLFAARRTAMPLGRILDATHALAEGGQAKAVPAHHRDEIGLLGEAFNDMARRLHTANDELHQHNENLSELIAERTVELEEANQKLAEQIADKDAFLRSVSHDLNAPLRNIDGMANMVLRKHRDTLDEEVVRKLERICANVKQETELINELIELNRLRDKKKKDDNLVDLNELVKEIYAGLSHQTEEARIETRIEGTLPTLRVERTRIRQVFQNLIDNAAKYMMDSEIREIVVRCDQDLDFYRLSVADTGRGIAWKDQPKVFQVFNRATHSGTHHVQGKGVGLASVKSIVEGYGGQIWVDSELGEGSTFTFTLNRATVSPPLETAEAE